MSEIKFIVYNNESSVEDEVLITTPELEKSFIEEWFFAGSGRHLDDYTISEHNETGVLIRSKGFKVM
jgi:hypothetical protein